MATVAAGSLKDHFSSTKGSECPTIPIPSCPTNKYAQCGHDKYILYFLKYMYKYVNISAQIVHGALQ